MYLLCVGVVNGTKKNIISCKKKKKWKENAYWGTDRFCFYWMYCSQNVYSIQNALHLHTLVKFKGYDNCELIISVQKVQKNSIDRSVCVVCDNFFRWEFYSIRDNFNCKIWIYKKNVSNDIGIKMLLYTKKIERENGGKAKRSNIKIVCTIRCDT